MAYKVPADPKSKSAWKTEVLNNSLHATHNFDPVQWDSDPAFEMLIGGREGSFLYDSKRTSGLVQLGGSESGGAGEIRLGKMKSGRRFFATVEPMHGTNLVVYLEPLGPQPKQWERHVLDSTLVDGHALACGDLTGQGSDQIVVGWRAMGKTDVKVGIKLFTMQADDPTRWTSTLVDDNQMACEDLCLADLNNDGKLDIIASGRGTKNVKIYFNESSP